MVRLFIAALIALTINEIWYQLVTWQIITVSEQSYMQSYYAWGYIGACYGIINVRLVLGIIRRYQPSQHHNNQNTTT